MRNLVIAVAAASSLLAAAPVFAADYFGAPTTRAAEVRTVAGYGAPSVVDPVAQTRSDEARSVAGSFGAQPGAIPAPRDPERETRSDAAAAVVVPR